MFDVLRLIFEAHLHLSKVRLLKFTNTKQDEVLTEDSYMYSGRFEEALDRRPFRSCFDPDYMGGFNLVASFNIADSFRVYSFFNPE